jgi:hypothetical protein
LIAGLDKDTATEAEAGKAAELSDGKQVSERGKRGVEGRVIE